MINEVRLIGNLGQDPDVRQGQSGTMANISIATSNSWKDKQGNWQSKTEWHRVVAFGFAADAMAKLKKGDQAYVAGSLQTRKWTDRDGNDKYTTEIKAQTVRKLGPKDIQSEGPPPYEGGGHDNYDTHENKGGTGDDMPF